MTSRTSKKVPWSEFKTYIAENTKLFPQYLDVGTSYRIEVDNGAFVVATSIAKSDTTDINDFEDNFKDDFNQQPFRITNEGASGNLTVGTMPVAARTGGANLANRKSLTVFNNGNQTVYWGYADTVTVNNGTPIFKGQLVEFEIEEDVTVWLVASQAGQDIRIGELA